MSQLLQIKKQLEVASERILKLERALRDNPNLPSIAANLESAVRVRAKLEQQFAEVGAKAGYDICRYRAFDDFDRPVVGPVFNSIAGFQRLVSVVYAAIKHGYRERASVPENAARESAFDLGYAFTGSIGVVLTVRNEKTLFENSYIDESLEAVFSMAKARTIKQVSELAEKLGPGPINALYDWADANAESGLSAEIDWRKGDIIQKSVLVQRQELAQLKATIEQTSSEKIELLTIEGKLTMADATKNKFKMERFGLPIIQGTVHPEAIDDRHKVTIPSEYSAKIQKTTRVRFSTGQKEEQYHLIKLGEPKGNIRKSRRKHA